MDGMSDVERLAAIEEIKLLKGRRDHAVDTKDWVTFEALHAPDHISHNEGFEPWSGAAKATAIISRLMADTISCHHSHTPQITFESPTKAKGIWGMEDNLFWKQGDEDHWLNGFGFYHETYEKRGGRWMFTYRQLKRLHILTSPGAMSSTERAALRERNSSLP